MALTNYTFSLTPAQDALLTWIVAKHNRDFETTLTNAQYVALRVPDLMSPYSAAYQEELLANLEAAFTSASLATQVQVKTLLGF